MESNLNGKSDGFTELPVAILPGVTACTRALEVAGKDGGTRLDLFLARELELSRAAVRRLLARGVVRVDGRAVGEAAKGASLVLGARVEVAPFVRPEDQKARAEPASPLRVLASGPGWLALDKPAGVAVHPLREQETGTLLNAILARDPAVHGIGEGGLRSGVVHRLDIDTSGVVLFATREDTWQRLRGGFGEGRVEKVYRALVRGRLDRDGNLELPLITARHRPARVRVVDDKEKARGAWRSSLQWHCLEELKGATWVEVRPKTGFLHQIRVSFAHLGFPILGDRVYGPRDDGLSAPRQMLHAARVRFEDVEAESPEPEDMAALRRRLGGGP